MKYIKNPFAAIPKVTLMALTVYGTMLAHFDAIAQEKKPTEVVKVHVQYKTQISGVVISTATGKPVLGARVFYKNMTSTITGEDGKFQLTVPSSSVAVNVECPGFASVEIPVAKRAKFNVYLQDVLGTESNITLPTGTISEQRSLGAVASSAAAEAWSQLTESADTYMQGRIAGLNSTRFSGSTNIGSFFTIRGYNSLQATNRPLIVVDNVIYDSGIYGNSLNSNYFDNPLSYIDIRDISNISVLKDASAAALYGTKGANGVIMITTSRAKELGTKIDFALYGGVNMAPKDLPVMGVNGYKSYLSDLLLSQGLNSNQISALPYMNDNTSNPDYYTYHNNTDWQKKVYASSPLTNMFLKVTGGDNIAKYALSVNYLSNKNGVIGSTLEKYSTRFNADMNLSRKLTAAANLSFAYNEAEIKDFGFASKTNPIYLALVKAPFLTDYRVSSQGIFSPDYADHDVFNIGNPIVAAKNTLGGNKAYRFFGVLDFKYAFNENLKVGTNIAVTFDKIKENRFIPNYGLVADTLKNTLALNQLSSQTKRLFNISNETFVSYDKTFKNVHELSARLGVRFISSRVEQDKLLAYNSATDQLISVGNGLVLYNNIEGGIGTYNWMNTYGSVNYSYSDKYFLGLNVGMDASSRFGKEASTFKVGGTPIAIMPSLSAAWLLSAEPFLADGPFDLLKLRGSIGQVGNDDIGNYSSKQFYVGQNLLGLQGLVRGNIANPSLKWETVAKSNLGLDVAVLKERISLSVDVFQNKTSDMIVAEVLPTTAGLGYALTNSGAMTTKGFEASINFKVLNKSSVKWDLGVNLAHAKSTIDQLPNGNADIVTNIGAGNIVTRVGDAPNSFFGTTYKGVYATDAEAAAEGLQTRLPDGTLRTFQGGDARFADLNGDKIIDDKDRTILGNPNPTIYGGITNRVVYKNWTLDALVSFVSGNDVYNYTRRNIESGDSYNNQSRAVEGRWRGNGQVTNIPRATYGDPLQNSRFSSRWIEDGSYIRLRSVGLSYNFNVDKGILKYLTVYANANNVLTFTKYLGYDPEFSATNSVIGQGVDNTLEPIQKSFNLGVKLGL